MDRYDLYVRTSTARQKERQDAVIDYLVKNSHLQINKQMIIDALTEQGKGSRVTIRKALEQLKLLHIIKIRPDNDKENSQTHWVSLNSDSEMLRVMENIQIIRDTFFGLLQEASKLPKEGEIDFGSQRYEDVTGAEFAITTLFEHLVGTFMLYFLLEWPKRVTDLDTRHELYTLTFQKIQEIQIRLLEVFPHPDQMKDARNSIIENLFILKHDELISTVARLEGVGFGKQTKPLLDQLWSFSLPFAHGGSWGPLYEESRWRDVIAAHRKAVDRSRRKDIEKFEKIMPGFAEFLQEMRRRRLNMRGWTLEDLLNGFLRNENYRKIFEKAMRERHKVS